MKNILKSLGLWEFVKKRFDDPELEKEEGSEPKKKEVEGTSSTKKLMMEERLMKDAKALGLIQGVVADKIFPRISQRNFKKGSMGYSSTRI